MTLDEFTVRALSVPFELRGRSWQGWDCWGLVFVARQAIFNETIEQYTDDYDSHLSYGEIDTLVNQEKPQWIETQQPEPGDVALFRVGKYQSHVALVIPNRRMLHTEQRAGTFTERLDNLVWSKRNVGYFRRRAIGSGIAPATTGT